MSHGRPVQLSRVGHSMQLRSVHVACCMLHAACSVLHSACWMLHVRCRYCSSDTIRDYADFIIDETGCRWNTRELFAGAKVRRRIVQRISMHHATVGRQRAVAMPCWRCIPSPLGRSFRPRPSRARLLLLQIYIGQELLSYFFESVPTPRLRCTTHVVGCLRRAVQRCRARVACRTVLARCVRRRRPRFTAIRTHLIRILRRRSRRHI